MANSDIAVGPHAVEAVVKYHPQSVIRILYNEKRHDRRMEQLLALARNQGVDVVGCPAQRLTELCGHEQHQSIIAEHEATVAKDEHSLLSDLKARMVKDDAATEQPLLVLVLDGVQDPHNLGACLRTADAAGADAVVVPRKNAVGITPVVTKVAAGATASVPFYQVTNLSRTLSQLQTLGIWIYGAAGEATDTLYQKDFTTPVALVLGAEGTGLRSGTRKVCDELYSIPMAGQVSSLNVSVATGVSLFEVCRQRQNR